MDKTPTIFLDVDGVLLPYIHRDLGPEDLAAARSAHLLFPSNGMIDRVCDLAERTGAQVVLCSSWRGLYKNAEEFIAAFGLRMGGVVAEAWRTPPNTGLRGEDVCEWLDTNGWRPYAIIDDESDFYRWQPVVYTDPYTGLTEENCEQVAALLLQQHLDGVFKGGMRYSFGDFVKAPQVIVAHGCNAQGAMASGAAKAVIDRYPKNKKMYQQYHREHGLKLGQVLWHWDRDDELRQPRIIANCITQEYYGRDGKKYVDYDAIRTAYSEVADVAVTNHWDMIATCQVGAGLAGGDWNVILNILEELGVEKNVTFKVYFNEHAKYYEACKQYRTHCHAKRHSQD